MDHSKVTEGARMLKWITAERTSSILSSDNAIRQRQLAAYYEALKFSKNKAVLELGCGEGAGTSILAREAGEVVAIDYSKEAIGTAEKACSSPVVRFRLERVPPIPIQADRFEVVVMFQMIEHIIDPRPLIIEIRRILNEGGILLVSTVNREESLTDNPFHCHEYDREDLDNLLKSFFPSVVFYGQYGDENYRKYLEKNRSFVDTVMKLDILGISSKIPPGIRKILYSLASRLMRVSLRLSDRHLCDGVTWENFVFHEGKTDGCLDFFVICRK